uniref:RGM domain family, member D n=2 Tax=Paramormyrops kingsleyae TaxID=1676925 RepID=A0A3B3SHQ2_9TELE|nr:repulsive guidance molecule A-like isoform X1 [Paramormyrops kingsleyae]
MNACWVCFFSRVAEQSRSPIPTEWIGMGTNGPQTPAERLLCTPAIVCMIVLLSLWRRPVCGQQCQINHCNAEYVASTSHFSGHQGEPLQVGDPCSALRAYSRCTRRTARSCRGDLVFHSAVFRIRELLAQRNCSSDGPTPSSAHPTRPFVPETCDYESRRPAGPPRRYAHCGLFGDPHLRTFRGQFQTCRAQGAWPLIDNRYLSVQVTNVPVVAGSSATATSKITVIFKVFASCTEQKVYQATTEDFPSVFLDGSRGGGSLWITERVGPRGQQVWIQARHVGATVAVRRAGRYLSFAARVPEDVLDVGNGGSLQLCRDGCPRSELIDRPLSGHPERAPAQPLPPRPGYSAELAAALCRQTLRTEDVYFQLCVFDLLATGDLDFTTAALGALEDFKALPPSQLEQTAPERPHLCSTAPPRTLGPVMTTPGLLVALFPLLLLLL